MTRCYDPSRALNPLPLCTTSAGTCAQRATIACEDGFAVVHLPCASCGVTVGADPDEGDTTYCHHCIDIALEELGGPQFRAFVNAVDELGLVLTEKGRRGE